MLVSNARSQLLVSVCWLFFKECLQNVVPGGLSCARVDVRSVPYWCPHWSTFVRRLRLGDTHLQRAPLHELFLKFVVIKPIVCNLSFLLVFPTDCN